MKYLLFLFVFLFASLIFSATIFGPVRYERTSGPPNVYDTSFVAYDTTLACTLLVVNGDGAGDHRVSAASVEFNGEEIISESDFNQRVDTILRVINLLPENSFHLRLRSGPGDFLTLSILRPCDAFVSLSVDTVIGDSACFSASASGWGNLTYYWDFNSDGTFDTTTSDNEICHVYEEPDTYLAKVQAEDEAGCVAVDSAEIVIEEMEYTFESELLWSYDLSGLPWQDSEPKGYSSISQDGDFVALRAGGIFNSFRGGALFYRGNLIYSSSENPRIDNISVSHNGQFAIVPIYDFDLEVPGKIICINTLGNTLWECDQAYTTYWKAFISEDESLVGTFAGKSRTWDRRDMVFVERYYNKAIIVNAASGDVVNILDEDLWGQLVESRFRNDCKFFYLLYSNDSLAIYNRHFELLNTAYPTTDSPPACSLSYFCLTNYYEISRCDNNIYLYVPYFIEFPPINNAPYSFWIAHPDGEFIIQAVCLDSLGNIIWRKNTDGLKVGRFQMSYSGKYTLGYTDEDCPIKQIALWNTQTNELLFSRNFPQDTSYDAKWSKWCDIYENPENDHILIKVTTQDTTIYLYANGTDANVDLQGITLFPDNAIFGYRKDENIFKLFRVRW
ncbi:PKD domain-containing protein [bacterium]|nr:PKD domain-containing protein [bacterium]